MEKTIETIKAVMQAITEDIDKDTKAARARVRKATLAFEKAAKDYRRQSVEADKK